MYPRRNAKLSSQSTDRNPRHRRIGSDVDVKEPHEILVSYWKGKEAVMSMGYF